MKDEKKQTAVEWLFNKLDVIIELDSTKWDKIAESVAKAKEMEKQQIIDTFQDSRILSVTNNCSSGKQYYNETFKKD
jgi:hypothetical protein